MRALTLYRPWAFAIVHGPKRIENRDWAPPPGVMGKFIAIHAGNTFDRDGEAFVVDQMKLPQLPSEANDKGIVGVARVVGVVDDDDDAALKGREEQSEWYFGPKGWVLDDCFPLPQPIAIKGALGLWTVPGEIEAKLRSLIILKGLKP